MGDRHKQNSNKFKYIFRKKNLFQFILLIILAITFCLLSNAEAKGSKKTITRTNDYIIIHGKKLTNNLNKKISNLSLLASIRGRIRPIPFQVDELDPQNEWVLKNVPPDIDDEDIKPDEDKDKGHLDENDELVFMIKDTGNRISKRKYPKKAEAVDEIVLVDPVNKRRAWAYLCSFKKKPQLSTIDYVNYLPPKNQIKSDSYVLGFPPDQSVFPSYLSIQGSKNILDRVKIRVKVKIFGIPYSMDETEFESRLTLYNDGPIRTIRRTRNSIKIMGIFSTPSAAIEMISYKNISIIPIRIVVPINIRSYNSIFSSKTRAGADFQNVNGWRFKTDVQKKWVNINGEMDIIEKSINGQDLSWFLLAGEKKAFLIRNILNRKPDGSYQDTPFTPHLYYVDDAKIEDPPENVPGQSPNVNLWMDGFDNLQEGTLYFYMIFYIMDNYKDGMEKKYIQILDRPINTIINPDKKI